MAKAKNLSSKTAIAKIVHKPLNLVPCTGYEGKFETTIQGTKITATFSNEPDHEALKLAKTILIDSHTNGNHGRLRKI